MLGLWCATTAHSSALPPPTIVQSYPDTLALAGTQVLLDGSGFAAGAAVTFTWDAAQIPSGDPPASANGGGSFFFEPVSVPLSLAPGTHDVTGCPALPGTCTAPLPIQVGPALSTTASEPVQRGDTVTITVADLQGGRTPLFGWNGTFATGTPASVPDLPSFDTDTTVPAAAPTDSEFGVCQEQAPGSGVCTPGTVGTLAIAVAVPAPPPPTPSVPAPVVPVVPVVPSSSAAVSAPYLPAATPTPTPSVRSSPARTPPATPTFGPEPKPSVAPVPLVATPKPSTQSIAAKPVALFTPKATVHLEVAAFAILTMVGGGGMLRGVAGLALPGVVAGGSAGAVAAGGSGGSRAGKAAGAKVKKLKSTGGSGSAGDDSRSWRWPGTARMDTASLALPVRAGPLSPLLARVLIDGSYVRAMLGSASLLLPLVGVVLGVLGALDTHGQALPPAVGLLTALAVLGVLDAFAGFVGGSVFVVVVAAAGGFGSAASIRTMLGLGVVWFAVPLIAGAARPLRRHPGQTVADRRQRLGDFVIASLIGFWAIQKMISALPGLAQRPLPVARDATAIAFVVLAASVLRIALEGAASRWYPGRLAKVQPAAVPFSGAAQRIAAAFLRTGIFVFVAIAFTGNHWQLWATGLLFLAPQVLSIYEGKFVNSTRLYRWLPRGILKTVIMLFVGTALGTLVLRLVEHSANAALNALVLLAAASLALAGLSVFGRVGDEPEEGWLRWLGGVGVLGVGVLFVLGFVG
jgi:hypothetical protein